jgi:hypothetical protein
MNAGIVSRNALVWLAALVGLAAAHYVRAEEPVTDPPGRVARLSLMDGEVSLAPAGTEEWADGVLNRPITSGDRLWVGKDGRAELQIGTSSVHLDRSTGFEFIELDDDVNQMSLTEGVATIRVRTLGDRESIQMETPNATVRFLHPGDYTVQVDPDSDRTIVRTRNGEAEVSGASKSFRVRANEEGTFTGLDGLTANIGSLSPRTPFESWANDRDRRGDNSEASRYVSREVVGYEDLDGHGDWIHEPSYGYVWRPTYVVADWAPYRYGRWGWVAPWGWTWIDAAPWGFAPFHYGRWAFVSHRWCWVPGPRHIRPYYAPALVGWIGGPSVSVSVSFGSGVGWFPLAPHEVYVPWYRHTPRYVRHVNVSNTIIVNNINITNVYGRRGAPSPHYRYGTIGNAVTAAHRDVFVSGRPVGAQRVLVNDRELRQWRSNVRPASIAPERQSILAGQPRRHAPPPAAFANDNPKRGSGDFRATRVAAEQIKRAQARQRNITPENRIALREPVRLTQAAQGQSSARQSEREQNMRGREQNERRREQNDTPRRRDHMERAPAVQSLQSSPSTERRTQSGSNELRRQRESVDERDTFQRSDNDRRAIREQPHREIRQQPREQREAPPARQFSQPEPRQQAPIERRAAPPVVREQPREQPRVERQSAPREIRSSPPPQRAPQSSPPPRQSSNQGSSRNNSSDNDRGGDGPRNWRDRSNR